jgi:hypothetical protein
MMHRALPEIDTQAFHDPDSFPEETVVAPLVDSAGDLLPLPIKCREGQCGDKVEGFLNDGSLITGSRRESAFIAACDMAARGFPQEDAERRIIERLSLGGPDWTSLSGDDLEDVPRQVSNAYSESRQPVLRNDECCTLILAPPPPFTITPTGRGTTCKVVVEIDGTRVVDQFNPSKNLQRRSFLRECRKRLPQSEAVNDVLNDLERQLEAVGANGQYPQQPDRDDFVEVLAEITDSTEIDDSHTIRPDVFVPVTEAGIAYGVTIEERHIIEGEQVIGTRTYGRHFPSGEKFCETSPEFISVGGRQFFFSPRPQPSAPADQKESLTSWSTRDRHGWLTEDGPPQDACKLFDDVYAVMDRFTEFSPARIDREHKLLLTTFVIFTYAYARFPVAPYLSFTGSKGSGKTTAMSVLKQLVFGPIPVSAASDAYLFRRLDKFGGTLLYDEAEDLEIAMEQASDKWKMLLSGTKTGSPVGRCVGDDHRTKTFHVFGPKVLAGTTPLPDTLLSRCISTVMVRCKPGSKRADEKPDSPENREFFQNLRDRLYRFWLDHGGALAHLPIAELVSPEGLQAREREVWLPLLQMAAILEALNAAPGLLSDLKRYAADPDRVPEMASASGLNPLQRDSLQAFAALHPGADAPKAKFPTASQVLEEMRKESPQTYNLHKPETISKTLGLFHIETKKTDGRRVLFIELPRLMDLFERYGMKSDGHRVEEAMQPSTVVDRPSPLPLAGPPEPVTGPLRNPTGSVDRVGSGSQKAPKKAREDANRVGRDGSSEGAPEEKKITKTIPIRRPGQ